MDTYHITGGKRLEGAVRVSGAKNAVLPVMAAAVMCRDRCVIYNCPDLSDVRAMMKILTALGCVCRLEDGVLTVDSADAAGVPLDSELTGSLRSSVFLMGPMLTAFGVFESAHPGGCAIGRRPVDMHLYAARCLGAEAREDAGRIYCRRPAAGLRAGGISFGAVSVGATENAMMAAVLADGVTTIKNAAMEPEVAELQRFLNSMGARVSGAGTPVIRVEGAARLHGARFTIMPDRIEAGTLIAAAAAAGGSIELSGAPAVHMRPVLDAFTAAGCSFRYDSRDARLQMRAPARLKSAGNIVTAPYPGFPTDMQPQLMAAVLKADGVTSIQENVFERRLMSAAEFAKMGADITAGADGRTAVVKGVSGLHGARVCAADLRGGAALVIAALSAEGSSIVENVCYIDRGYDTLEAVLQDLGAEIYRIKEEING